MANLLGAIGIDANQLLQGISTRYDTERARAEGENDALRYALQTQAETQQATLQGRQGTTNAGGAAEFFGGLPDWSRYLLIGSVGLLGLGVVLKAVK